MSEIERLQSKRIGAVALMALAWIPLTALQWRFLPATLPIWFAVAVASTLGAYGSYTRAIIRARIAEATGKSAPEAVAILLPVLGIVESLYDRGREGHRALLRAADESGQAEIARQAAAGIPKPRP